MNKEISSNAVQFNINKSFFLEKLNFGLVWNEFISVWNIYSKKTQQLILFQCFTWTNHILIPWINGQLFYDIDSVAVDVSHSTMLLYWIMNTAQRGHDKWIQCNLIVHLLQYSLPFSGFDLMKRNPYLCIYSPVAINFSMVSFVEFQSYLDFSLLFVLSNCSLYWCSVHPMHISNAEFTLWHRNWIGKESFFQYAFKINALISP